MVRFRMDLIKISFTNFGGGGGGVGGGWGGGGGGWGLMSESGFSHTG